MKRKQPFWVRLFSPVRLKTQKIYVAGSHPRVRLAAFNVFVGIGSFLVAFLLGSVLMIPGESNAEDVSVLSNDASLSVALTPEAMNLAVTPTPDGTLTSDELAIQVSTDNTTGYTLTLALAGSESSLYDPTSGGEIQSTTAAMRDPNTLAVNTWGWYPDSLVNNTGNLFSALPSNSDPYELKKTSSPTSGSGDTTTISFGVNVDTTLPAGSYTNAIVISAVTNYVPQPILDVYPTTGWAGDTITLYSNGGFVNVQSVTIGGTDCTSINVKSADELTCTLPSKAETDTTSGTDNGYSISVTASNTSLDTHNFTIRYFNPNRTETASVSNTQITNTNMSNFTNLDCGSLSVGDIISLTDERNSQTYRIKKMQDEKCWMVDNIKYKGEGITISNIGDGTEGIALNDTDGRYNTVDGTNSTATSGTGTNWDKAFYNNPMSGSYCYGTSIQSSYTKCGYLYNWYAATAGTGTYATSTQGTNVSGSICPAGWRLPTAYDGGYSNADFAVLNASMNAGSLTSGSLSNYYTGWLFAGDWHGILSGFWASRLSYRGSAGYYWSSTAASSSHPYSLGIENSNVRPGGFTSAYTEKYIGHEIRCIQDVQDIEILDVYPTTGWSGNTIKITLSRIPRTGIASVTIGGTACNSIDVLDNTISCILPTKLATADNGYAIDVVANDEHNYISLDDHNFIVRYFDPARIETIGSNTTANVNMQNFTQSNCGAMIVGQIVSLTDSRNNQTYRIKKMQDEKCWMIDNMKYKGEGITIVNIGDGSEGIILNDSESRRLNTVDGTNSTATSGTGTNWDKAFYNNPMVASYCYGDSIQSSYTKCGYLYNWYAATAGTGTYAISASGTNVSGSICPTGWRLPSATSDGTSPTASGTSIVAADFPVLNASMNAGSLASGSTDSSYYADWQFDGDWSGVFSGAWGPNGRLEAQGSGGYYWSSTSRNTSMVRPLIFFADSAVYPGTMSNSYGLYQYDGEAVRCMMDGAVQITFDGNGAYEGFMEPQFIGIGQSANLNYNEFNNPQNFFVGWNTEPDGSGDYYGDGAVYSVSTNPTSYFVTLYAQWEFDSGGHSG